MVLFKIMSGGQTGVDRAALDVALQQGVPCGGWCPKGRRAEDGPIPDLYPLEETPSSVYPQRTEWNVRDSDGTLVLTLGAKASRGAFAPTGRASRVALAPGGAGTALTIELARRQKKPYLVVNLNDDPDVSAVRTWAQVNQIRVLNVAGPRESEKPGVYSKATEFLRHLLDHSEPGA
jgi:hypothetical protein